MTVFPEDLRTFLIASTSLSDSLGTTQSVHYNFVPQHMNRAYIWFRTASDTVPRTLDQVGGIHEAFIDIEVVADSESNAQTVADHVHARLDGVKTAAGNSSIKGMFLADKEDDYLSRNIDSDDGRHVIAYELRVWYST